MFEFALSQKKKKHTGHVQLVSSSGWIARQTYKEREFTHIFHLLFFWQTSPNLILKECQL